VTIERLVKIDRMLGRCGGATANEIGNELSVTPRHARRLLDRIRDGFGGVWDLQVVESRHGGAVRYRYRTRGASAFSDLGRVVA
jgi:predicted ArsR family transcriptional regulator